MQLIPAIDLKDGKCVRLRQGRMVDETVFSDDPLAVADRWVEAGARRLHLVDLDGALAGFPVNADLIGRIAEAHPGIEVQVGGGLRSFEVIQTYLDVGVNYVIIGTQAVRTPSFVDDACLEFPGRIMVGLDAREGRVATEAASWLASTPAKAASPLTAGRASRPSPPAIWRGALKTRVSIPSCSPTSAATA